MNRVDFIRKSIRYLLLLLMAFIVMALGKRVVTGKDCTACPGNGTCNGIADCSKY